MPYTVALDAFHGPLDLLLYLVKKHEVDVLDIPIADDRPTSSSSISRVSTNSTSSSPGTSW